MFDSGGRTGGASHGTKLSRVESNTGQGQALDTSDEVTRILDSLAEIAPVLDLVGRLLRRSPHNKYLNVLARNVTQRMSEIRIQLDRIDGRAQDVNGRCDATQPGRKPGTRAAASVEVRGPRPLRWRIEAEDV